MTIDLNNLGTVNKNKVVLWNGTKNVVIIFSYETPVVVYGLGKMVVHQNDWSTTTGKLLNEHEPDKKRRVNHEDFTKFLTEVMEDFSK